MKHACPLCGKRVRNPKVNGVNHIVKKHFSFEPLKIVQKWYDKIK
jgi:hypothetical protein